MGKRKNVAVIADIETIEGLSLGGIVDRDGIQNIWPVSTIDTVEDINKIFQDLIKRKDLGVILVSRFVSVKLGTIAKKHDYRPPIVFVIPSKNKNI